MIERPDPSHHIKSGQIQPTPPELEKEKPTKKFGTMSMTKKEFKQFLNGFVKMMLTLIKKGETRMTKAMKKIGDPDHPD